MQLNSTIDQGKNGAKRASWKRDNPREVLFRLLEKNPDASEDELADECWEIIRDDLGQLQTVYEYWFANNYRSLIRGAASPAERQARRSEKDKEVAAIAKNVSQKVAAIVEARVQITLATIMPTGKMLRDSTKEELQSIGGWALAVANKLKPGQTVAGARLTAAQISALYPR